jgi:2-methylcitrate dehydratase PrpD
VGLLAVDSELDLVTGPMAQWLEEEEKVVVVVVVLAPFECCVTLMPAVDAAEYLHDYDSRERTQVKYITTKIRSGADR